MAAYLIADTDITDPATYDEYKRRVPATLAPFGGRFIVRGGAFEMLEGSLPLHRLVVIEFPSMQALRDWYRSPEYAPLLKLRQPAARDHLVAVEGV